MLGVRRPGQTVVLGLPVRPLLFPRLSEEGPCQASGEFVGYERQLGRWGTSLNQLWSKARMIIILVEQKMAF